MEDLGLDPRVMDAVRELGISSFTDPQVRAIPRILAGANVLLVAPTGIGKTEAAVLPLLDRILREGPDPVTPGAPPPPAGPRTPKPPPDILVTTPETFQILFTGRRLREQLRNVRWVVLDEIHELASDERGAQLAVGLERLRDLVGREFQRVGLSATVGSPEEVGRYLVGMGRDVEVIRADVPKGLRIGVEMPTPEPQDAEAADRLRVQRIQATAMRRCHELIKDHRSTLFFVNTRDTAEFLSSRMAVWFQDPTLGVHHGSLSRDVRVQMEDAFKSGTLRG